jgi:elongation factor Ts
MITAAEINKLRMQTGAGMMDCKKALEASNGDFDGAIDYLRAKGAKVAALRNDREAKEGAVIALTTADNTKGIVVCVNCETDFVAKNDAFVAFATSIANVALSTLPNTIDELLNCKLDGVLISERLNEQVGKIGEKISIGKYEKVESSAVVPYIHAGNKLGVLVALNKLLNNNAEIGKDIAMQIAAMNPIAINEAGVSSDRIEKERSIVIEQMKADPKMAGKTDDMLGKIAEGKLNAFFKESTLINQFFVKDNSKTIADFLKGCDKDLTVTDFKRVTLN